MPSRESNSQIRSSRAQPQRVPPPVTWGSETLEGEEVLKEFPGELGLVLWKSARTVALWAELTPKERRHGFVVGAYEARLAHLRSIALAAELREPLEVVAGVLKGSVADPEALAQACRQASDWAAAEEALGTALAFIQAAALTSAVDASLAFAVGQIARRRTEYGRAETWYRHAIMLARRRGDWSSYALSYLGLARMYLQRGNFPAARRSASRAARAAGRHGLYDIQGMAFHDLAAVAIRAQKGKEAAQYTRAALHAYGPGHGRLAALAHDIAYFWMTQGLFATALRIFQAQVGAIQRPIDRLHLFSSIARSAGGAGERGVFEEAWMEVGRLLEHPNAAEGSAGALVELAHGAASSGDWDRAAYAARRALALALERGEAEARIRAEALLESMRSERFAEAELSARNEQAAEEVRSLAEELIASLETATAAAR